MPKDTEDEGYGTDHLRELAARASTIEERLAGGYVPCEPVDEIERNRAQDRLAAWRRSATAGNADLFAERLAREGLDEARAVALLGSIQLESGQPLPRWATAFAWAAPTMAHPATPSLQLHERDDAAAGPGAAAEPFDELLWPVVRATWCKLERRAGDLRLQHWSYPACTDLQRGLLRRLSAALAPALYADFNLFRHLWRFAPGRLSWPFSIPGSRIIYDGFLADWRNGRWREFFLMKPVAARLLGTTVSSWLDVTAELLQRLHRDDALLAGFFAGGLKLGQVTSVLSDRSDPHRGGRTVAILRFSDRVTLVYKPKDLRVDLAWTGLLRWLEQRGSPVTLRTVPVLARYGYGWAGHVTADQAASASDPALFYRQAGGLLAVVHLLRGSDFHDENVITSLGLPIPIDLETLLRPALSADLAMDPGDPAVAAAVELITSSVLATHYLPLVRRQPNGGIEAIGGIEPRTPARMEWDRFRHVNTDAMEQVSSERSPPPQSSSIEAADAVSQLAEHTEDIVAGFDEMYRFLLQHRRELVGAAGPLRRFSRVRVRVVLEETAGYQLVAAHAAGVRNLGNGADWSLHFDFLSRNDLGSAMSQQRAAVRAAELRALANLDIPLFTARANADGIDTCRGDRIEHCLADSPFNQLLAHIGRFGPADREFQVRLIRSVLQPGGQAGPRQALPVRLAGARRSALAEANRLGELLTSTAVRAGGSATWIGPVPLDHDHRTVRVVGLDLYSGVVGIALFLAALARVTGDPRPRELAFAALGPERSVRNAADGGARTARLIGIGGAAGIGSILYGMVRIGTLLEEPKVIEEAQSLARLIDDGLIAADRSYDVISGATGAILGLLVLYKASGDLSVLARAVACGDHVLRGQITDDQGNTGWRTLPDTKALLTGFSHGAAGIAFALLRLHRITGETRFRDGACDALAYERRMFLPGAGNWPDLRSQAKDDSQKPPCQWCHGAAGIGLARVGCLESSADAVIAAEIEIALATTLNAPPSPADHLCCGNFGRLEFLLTAGRMMDRAELITTARERASELVERAIISGGYPCFGGDEGINPGLFQGISGIGYTLLRLVEPALVPSVLLWD